MFVYYIYIFIGVVTSIIGKLARLHSGAAAGCPCKALLSDCCLCFGAWLLQGGAAGCCWRVPLLVLLRWQASPRAVQRVSLLFFFLFVLISTCKGLGERVCLEASFRPGFGLVLCCLCSLRRLCSLCCAADCAAACAAATAGSKGHRVATLQQKCVLTASAMFC